MTKRKKDKKQKLFNSDINKEFLIRAIKNDIFRGKEIKINDSNTEKMSEIILRFAKPLLDKCDTYEHSEKIICFSILAWNLCLIPRESQKERIKEILDKFANDIKSQLFWNDQLKQLMLRKEMYFYNNHRYICDYMVYERQNELRLSIASIPLNKEL